MESENSSSLVKCCDCGCSCSLINQSLSGTYLRSVKRKCDEPEDENQLSVTVPHIARVEIGNECAALREMVGSQQNTVLDLISELEEERNASSSAANEAMSMILRLQREKAEVQMEARQFKRYVEEKMAHEQQETLALEDLLYKREQAIQSLTCEVQAYKHRMMSFGLTEEEIEEEKSMIRNNSVSMNMNENFQGHYEFPPYEIYPPLRCNTRTTEYVDCEDDASDYEKYAFGESPLPQDRFKDLESRINILEKDSPRTIQPVGELNSAKSVFEKVMIGQSPRRPRHLRKFSTDSLNSFFAAHPDFATDSPNYGASFKKTEFSSLEENSNLGKMDNASEDDMSDRIYTIDSVHQGASVNVAKAPVGIGYDDYMSTPRDSVRDLEVQKLYARLHALEADRESMRQAIITIGTDKAQVVLLKEIAQNLCKEMSPAKRMPVKKQSAAGRFSVKTIFKWMVSFVFWRRKAHRCKYMFGLSENNAGLLMLLEQGHRIGHWKYISRGQM